ncbi:hypothetical protein ElyMa_002477900 [Elysia marginata]|uniref:Uncharacterized protein n=1 Tax=Elysia marginata TaxID=1093978 RepID=A0AAV4GN25_9GAST|nr:hypothetical protein ElyMa_002477900 [Elysia marginata]
MGQTAKQLRNQDTSATGRHTLNGNIRLNLSTNRQLRTQLEEDYIQLATQVERRSSGPGEQQVSANGLPLCPVCNKTEIDVKALGPPAQLPAVCVDCKKTTCPKCGAFAPPLPNKRLCSRVIIFDEIALIGTVAFTADDWLTSPVRPSAILNFLPLRASSS